MDLNINEIIKEENKLYSGKAKSIYKINNEMVLINFRDDITAGNGEKHDIKSGKGELNALISTELFKILENNNIPTHFVEYIKPTYMVAKNVEIIPIEVIVRNIATGSLCKRYPFKNGTVLKFPIIQFDYKNDEYGDPMLNDHIALALNLATKEELEKLRLLATNINNTLKNYFDKIGINLVDFKIEIGRTNNGELVVADEISPDTMRLWDKKTNEAFDKDIYRKDIGNVVEKYKLLAEKMGLL